jgi:hypothetical protein
MQKAFLKTRIWTWRDSSAYLDTAIIRDYIYKYPTAKGISIVNAWFTVPEKVEELYKPQRLPSAEEKEIIASSNKEQIPANLLCSPEKAFRWLKIFELQYKKLRNTFGESIPSCEFGYSRIGAFLKKTTPAIKQEYIEGFSLWDMVSIKNNYLSLNEQHVKIKNECLEYLPVISKQLKKFLGSTEIDFNIENFIFSEKLKTLFYIDNEPAFLVPAEINRNNRYSIIKYIIDGNLKAG